jgi:hypothetical protein
MGRFPVETLPRSEQRLSAAPALIQLASERAATASGASAFHPHRIRVARVSKRGMSCIT